MKTIFPWVISVLFLLPAVALAESPRVRFDVPQTAAVRDVTSREFAFVHPHERLIEARVPISLLLERGPASDVREIVHRLESTTAGAQAVDYFPKTTLATDIVGTRRVEQQKARDVNATADIVGGYRGLASGQAHAEYNQRVREDLRYEQLPSLAVLSASGTVDRGRGVYFKLKTSPRTTLEGANEYTIVLRVPRAWRAGLLYVTSEARGVERSGLPGGDSSTLVGRGKFVVALYQQGDYVAQETAQRYANAEAALRHTSTVHRGTLERRMSPTPLHKLGFAREGALARDWQDHVIFRGSAGSEMLQQLPGDVRLAAETLLKVREELVELHRQSALASIGG